MKERLISAVSYIWIFFPLPLMLIPDSSFGRFHANQALLCLLCSIVFTILTIMGVLWPLVIIAIVYPVWGIVTALMGLKKPFPIIGRIVIIKH
jgi:uncharacterized membrane protein